MKFYHGTTIENATEILKEGFVLGKKKTYRVAPDNLLCVYAECEGRGFDYAVLNAQAAAAVQNSQEIGAAVMVIDIPDCDIVQPPLSDEEEYKIPCEIANEYLSGYYAIKDAYSPGTRLIILAHMCANGQKDAICADLNDVDREFLRGAEEMHESFNWTYINSLGEDSIDPTYTFVGKEAP